MRRILTFCVFAAIAAATGYAVTGPTPASAEAVVQERQFFRCDSGFTFETRNNAARCIKPASVETRPLENCPHIGGVGLFPAVDRSGLRDMCAGTNPVTGEVSVERACPGGYNKRIVRGPDRCERPLPAQVRAPSVSVNL